MTRLLFAIAIAIALSALSMSTASAAELLFIEIKGCPYCIRFDRQMAHTYAASEFGKKIPLRRVDLMRPWPADLKKVERPPYTPVFILVEDGREVGRFLGYMSPQQFNRELRRLVKKHIAQSSRASVAQR